MRHCAGRNPLEGGADSILDCVLRLLAGAEIVVGKTVKILCILAYSCPKASALPAFACSTNRFSGFAMKRFPLYRPSV